MEHWHDISVAPCHQPGMLTMWHKKNGSALQATFLNSLGLCRPGCLVGIAHLPLGEPRTAKAEQWPRRGRIIPRQLEVQTYWRQVLHFNLLGLLCKLHRYSHHYMESSLFPRWPNVLGSPRTPTARSS